MAHFAKLGMNGKVIQVLTCSDSVNQDGNGIENENFGKQFLEDIHNWPKEMWIQTSYNTRGGKHYNFDGTLSADQSKALKGNFAGIGFTYDDENDIFMPKKPYPSWVKDVASASWKSPVGDAPALTEEQINDTNNLYEYKWDEENSTWNLITISKNI
jgi:hypothetical protein